MPYRLKIIALTIIFLITLTLPVNGANILTWDTDYSRARLSIESISQLYSATPIAVSVGDVLNVSVLSKSTPIIYNDILYQYCYTEDQKTGFLVAVDISNPDPKKAADFPVLWAAKFTAEAGERFDGSPGPSISPDGKYMSMAIGKYLYIWPMSVNGSPNIPDSNGKLKSLNRFLITGNKNQNTNLIAMSPAITTASYTWQGRDLTSFNLVTFSAPITCAGSWNGGFVFVPLFVPDNIDPMSVVINGFTTTSINPNWAGEIFTSSPAVLNNGNGNIIFGVDGGYPLMFSFNPTTKKISTFGQGHIKYGISSAPVVDRYTGDIYVPDKMGNIYRFRSDGTFVSRNTSLFNGSLVISNIAVDQNYVFAVKAGFSEVWAIDKFTMATKQAIFKGSTGFIDPTVVVDPSTNSTIVAINDANGYVHTYSYNSANNGIFIGSGGLAKSVKGYAPPPYVSVVMAAGSNKLITSWTNDRVARNKQGALEFWVPQSGELNARVTPSRIQPNSKTTLYVDTTVDNTISKVVARLPDSSGTPSSIINATDMVFVSVNTDSSNKKTYRWQLEFTSPSNPGNYTLPVQLQYTSPGNDLEPINASATYEVIKPPGGIPSDGGATLTLKSYALPQNNIKKGEIFKPWPITSLTAQHPLGTTFLGDTILAELTIETPTLPDPSYELVSAYITSATIYRPEGYEDPVTKKWLTRQISEPMNPIGLSASLQFQQTWAGWEPGNYLTEPPAWAHGSLTLKSPGQQDTLYVDYTVCVEYRYPVEDCYLVPDGKGGYVEECSTSWESGSYNITGTASDTLTTWGTNFVVIPVISGSR